MDDSELLHTIEKLVSEEHELMQEAEEGQLDDTKHARMREAYEVTAKAARSHGKSFGVGGVREDLEFQTWLMELGMRYLTGGSDVGYILSAGRADVKRIREVRLS